MNAGKLTGGRRAVSAKSSHSIRHTVATYLRGGMTGTALFSPDADRLSIYYRIRPVASCNRASTHHAEIDAPSGTNARSGNTHQFIETYFEH